MENGILTISDRWSNLCRELALIALTFILAFTVILIKSAYHDSAIINNFIDLRLSPTPALGSNGFTQIGKNAGIEAVNEGALALLSRRHYDDRATSVSDNPMCSSLAFLSLASAIKSTCSIGYQV